MMKEVSFNIYPILEFIDDNDKKKIYKFTSKKIDKNLKNKIIKDIESQSFKKELYQDIFNTGVNHVNDISQYLDGKINAISYKNNYFNIKCSIFLIEKLPKEFSSFKKSDLLKNDNIVKLFTRKNIKHMIKENILHNYISRGHFKEYKFNGYDIFVDLSENIKNFSFN